MARPKKEVDEGEVRKLAAINCSVEEIANFFEVSPNTIKRRFGLAISQGSANGKMSLKRKMWTVAMSDAQGSVTMQIWLSKQMLGYRDQQDHHMESRADVDITYRSEWNDDPDAKTVQSAPRAKKNPSIG